MAGENSVVVPNEPEKPLAWPLIRAVEIGPREIIYSVGFELLVQLHNPSKNVKRLSSHLEKDTIWNQRWGIL